MEKLQPLFESLQPSEANVICESSNNNGTMWLNGVFMQAEIKNRNGRIYPITEMNSAITQATKTIKENGGIFGELDHPDSLTVGLDRISHAIMELHVNGSNVYGKAKLLRTPMGLIAEELGKSGVRYGISSRAAGQVSEEGIVSNLMFVTADLVATPSAPGAFPKPVYESLQNSKEGGKVLTLAESLIEDSNAQKYFKKEILNFVENVFNRS